jgi:hypothetical protein
MPWRFLIPRHFYEKVKNPWDLGSVIPRVFDLHHQVNLIVADAPPRWSRTTTASMMKIYKRCYILYS